MSKFFTAAGTFPGATVTDPVKVLKVLKDNNVRFQVFYFGGDPVTISIDDFIGNNAWYRSQIMGLDAGSIVYQGVGWALPNVVTSDGIVNDSTDLTIHGTLAVDEEGEDWGIILEYTPIDYSTDAYISHVSVRIPMYIFDGDITATKNAAAGTNNVRTVANGTTLGTTMLDDLFTAITDKWILTGSYSRGRDRQQKELDFTKEMFTNGAEEAWFGAVNTGTRSDTDPILLNHTWAAPQPLELGTTSLTSGQVGYDYPLPIWYREAYLEDAEETVIIDIYAP